MSFSATKEGQFYFHLLKEFGLTPAEWRALDPRDSTFLIHGFTNMMKEKKRIQDENRAKAKTRRR